MRRLALFALLGLVASAERMPVTLDVVAQSPGTAESISVPVWSPDGGSVAYLHGKKLWRYDVANKAKRELGSLEGLEKAAAKRSERQPFLWENRRVADERIQWTPDGRHLLLHVEGDLFLWQLDNGRWEQLTKTPEQERNPKLSPDGRFVSYSRSNELHLLEIAKKKERQLTTGSTKTLWNGRLDWVYPEELDLGTAHWWSPDGRRIAFLQFDVSKQVVYPHANLLENEAIYEPQRYPKAGTPNAEVRLGVIDTAGGQVRWMNVGGSKNMLLARVQWLPDSTRIAVQKLNRVQNELTLLFADAAKGNSKTVLTERSPHWINIASDLRFLKKRDAFVWSSEKDGFRHLYLHDYEGRELQRLTSGAWEVKSVAAVDEENGMLYFHSRERTPLGADLYSVGLDGGSRRLITEVAGQHAAVVAPDAKHFIDSHQSASTPVSRTLRRITGEAVEVLQPPVATAAYDILPSEVVQVRTPDDAVLYARVWKPARFDATRQYPAVVMVYGGPHAQNVCECWSGFSWEQALAQRGFVVWQLDNRGTAGRGLAWETKLFRRFGKQELEDQATGIRHLVSLGFVDPKRIGMYGWSYGGFLTLYSLLHSPGLLRAGIAGAPVTDWRNYDTIYTERYLGLPSENEEGYRLSSPVHVADKLKAALMLAHNFEDDNVLFQHTMQMMAALQKAGKRFETLIYPQRTHGVTGAALKKHMLESMTAFFERELAQKP